MINLILSLGICNSCGTLPDGSLSLMNDNFETVDIFRIHSGSRKCSVSSLIHPVYGSLPNGNYKVNSEVKGGDVNVPHREYFEIISLDTQLTHYCWHHPAPGYSVPSGILFPKGADWKRFSKLVSDSHQQSIIISNPNIIRNR